MTRYQLSDFILLKEEFESELIIVMKEENVHCLNETAALILNKIDIGNSEEEIVDFICKEYNLENRKEIEIDIRELINEMLEIGRAHV